MEHSSLRLEPQSGGDSRAPVRFNWDEMHQYWRAQSRAWADLDLDKDPDALANVLHSGAPDWLNQYYARFQRRTYWRLLRRLPSPPPGARALDVGCGAGRWARILASQGYATTGIDLQASLIEADERRFPHIRFICGSVQEFSDEGGFDVVSTVTVLQHLPFDEQDRAIEQIRRLLRPGGHVIVLENVRDQAEHVFANSVKSWSNRFRRAGLARLYCQRYDYSPVLRLLASSRTPLRRLFRKRTPAVEKPTPEALANRWPLLSADTSIARRLYTTALHAAVYADSVAEEALIRLNPALPTVHCGFVFRAL